MIFLGSSHQSHRPKAGVLSASCKISGKVQIISREECVYS